ncbi:spectrin beta [Niveomyces insectorum RCEF 264]|uniref:Spectrin beta n=1 Tax=Niveomyces insectorum RCEF 264 TaxID=1081102 RepID=A0A167LI75_9HYPO|nr:spectrin beta [Niveomyces insectorum RCEF 264]
MATELPCPIGAVPDGPANPSKFGPVEPVTPPVSPVLSQSSASLSSPVSSTSSLTRRTSSETDDVSREQIEKRQKEEKKEKENAMNVVGALTEPPPPYEASVDPAWSTEEGEEVAATRNPVDAVEGAAADVTITAAAMGMSSMPYKGKRKAMSAPTETPTPSPIISDTLSTTNTPSTPGNTPRGHIHASRIDHNAIAAADDVLPAYSCDIHMEGLFHRKREFENATQRAEDRRWTPIYVVLHGTVLEVHHCRKDRGWVSRKVRRGSPGASADRPSWMRKAGLERSYNLAYADVGIAADYVKRRYVVRIRAEADQFLLACVELETFVHWLDALFAALSIAAPIDERDFPRDQSIPRLQRIRWYYGRDRQAEALSDRERDRDRAREQERVQAPVLSRIPVPSLVPTLSSTLAEEQMDALEQSIELSIEQSLERMLEQQVTDDGQAEQQQQQQQQQQKQQKQQKQQHQQHRNQYQNLAFHSTVDVDTSSPPLPTPMPSPLSPAYAKVKMREAAAAAAKTATDETKGGAVSGSSPSSVSSVVTMAGPSTAPPPNSTPSPASPLSSSSNSGYGGGGGSRFSFRTVAALLANSTNGNKNNIKKKNSSSSSGGGGGGNNHYAYTASTVRHQEGIDATTGKWQPSHRWTKTHDMVYAKLCYATLLSCSPRKSNYIVVRGKQWLVDWATGTMVRVSPPRYGELELPLSSSPSGSAQRVVVTEPQQLETRKPEY